jgi:PAS domain S-box-containing protein
MTHAIVMIDSNGNVTHWDTTAEELFAYSTTEMVGQPIDLIVPVEFRDQHRNGLRRAMSGGERHLEGAATHLPVLHADGAVVCHPARFNHLFASDGRLISAAAVFGPPAPDQAPWSPIIRPGSQGEEQRARQ